MSTTQTPGPTLKNVGTKPAIPRKLFVNIPVSDLQRSINFFEALGFTFNQQFTDATTTAMLVGDDGYFMLLDRARFAGFAKRPQGDPSKETNAMFALSACTRAEVDEIVARAVAAGGSYAAEKMDHGFMYGWSFYDPDGYHWEIFWMDPSAING